MIKVRLNRPEFAYDIHSLVKAFYPAEDVNVCAGEKKEDNISKRDEQPVTGHASILFDKNSVHSVISAPDGTVLNEDRLVSEKMDDRKTARNVLKTLLYRQLSAITGKKLPWGNLTGIRPTKIPMDLLDEGNTPDEIRASMQEHYFVSAGKADLAVQTALREKKILFSLYMTYSDRTSFSETNEVTIQNVLTSQSSLFFLIAEDGTKVSYEKECYESRLKQEFPCILMDYYGDAQSICRATTEHRHLLEIGEDGTVLFPKEKAGTPFDFDAPLTETLVKIMPRRS